MIHHPANRCHELCAMYLVLEWEAESLAVLEKMWVDWWADPDYPRFNKEFIQLLDNEGSSEFFTVR